MGARDAKREDAPVGCGGERVLCSGDVQGVANTDHAVLHDVGVQAAAVHELAQDQPRCVALDDHAGLAQSHATAPGRAEQELVADQPLRSMPRVTMLRRCSSASKLGVNDSHTSAWISSDPRTASVTSARHLKKRQPGSARSSEAKPL